MVSRSSNEAVVSPCFRDLQRRRVRCQGNLAKRNFGVRYTVSLQTVNLETWIQTLGL